MTKEFCLLDEPWLPVRLRDGRVVELGLLETFARGKEIAALAETAPPNLVAQYRLLVAITHRAVTHATPGWSYKERVRWYRQGLPSSDIQAYLESWRDRFWLFHPQHPFMQVAALADAPETRDKLKPWTQISLANANGNAPVVFDHAYDAAPQLLSQKHAIATLLGFLQFTPGGLVKVLRDSDKAGPLVNTAAILPIGENLAETLSLCLHPAPTGRGEPDLPTWERDPLTIAALRGAPVVATGPNDRYTRQTRAVLFARGEEAGVRWLRFAAGLALGDDANAPDPMANFRQGSVDVVRLTFSDSRALWRDLPALLPNPSRSTRPAAVLNYAINLHEARTAEEVYQPILVAGIASDQAKLLRWRAERIALPAVFLTDVDKADKLRDIVKEVEELFGELRALAARMFADTLPDPGSKDTRARARGQLDTGPFATTFFAAAERALPDILGLLGRGLADEAETFWRAMLRQAAQRAWEQLSATLGRSTRALQADAKFWPRFQALLNTHVPKPDTPVKDV